MQYIDRPELVDDSGRAHDATVGKNDKDGWKNKNALVFSTAQIWVNSLDMHTLWMEQRKHTEDYGHISSYITVSNWRFDYFLSVMG